MSDDIEGAARPEDLILWLDLAGVTFFGSAGVSLILRAEREASARGGRLALLNPALPVLRVLDICRLRSHFEIRIG